MGLVFEKVKEPIKRWVLIKIQMLSDAVVVVVCNSFQPHKLQAARLSVHEIFQERILEWVAISYFRGSSRPRDQTCSPCVSSTGRQILLLTVPPGNPWYLMTKVQVQMKGSLWNWGFTQLSKPINNLAHSSVILCKSSFPPIMSNPNSVNCMNKQTHSKPAKRC